MREKTFNKFSTEGDLEQVRLNAGDSVRTSGDMESNSRPSTGTED